jgi:hypothetical protein
VEGATVSFRLPDEGATGAFTGGMKTDIAISASDGKATASTIQWDRNAGAVALRVTTAKDQVRAGTVVSLYISDAPVTPAAPRASAKAKNKWILIGLAVAGATAGGLAVGLTKSPQSSETPTALTNPSVQIGTPSISVGKP